MGTGVVDERARGGGGERDFLCMDQWFSKCGPGASARPGNLREIQVLRPLATPMEAEMLGPASPC